jgi:hypothetical protein
MKMIEIRLCWLPGVVHRKDDHVESGGKWMRATLQVRSDMKTLLEIATEIYGPGTHWIEERNVQIPDEE